MPDRARRRTFSALRPLAGAVAILCLAVACRAPAPAPAFRIGVAHEGVVRLTGQDLRAAGWERPGRPASDRLRLTAGGREVPIWVDDGGDGRFDRVDRIEWVGALPAGERTRLHPEARENVYRLDVAPPGALAPSRLQPAPRTPPGPKAALAARRHLEQDEVFLRFAGEDRASADPWYWARLSALDDAPWALPLDLDDLEPGRHEPVTVALELRGWSQARGGPGPDHVVEARLGVAAVGRRDAEAVARAGLAWNHDEGFRRLELPPVDPATLLAGRAELTLRVPERPATAGERAVDVVLLSAIDLAFPRRGHLRDRQERIEITPGDAGRLELTTAAGAGAPVLFGDAGVRAVAESVGTDPDGRRRWAACAALGAGFWAVPSGATLPPAWVEIDRPSELARSERQVDYLIVAHPRLLAAIEPLAAFHRARGLAVEVVDVRDVYDEWSHGVVDPRAIREFVADGVRRRRPPSPRFVLLVGDASWDARHDDARRRRYADWTFNPAAGDGIVRNRATTYAERADVNHRGLLPTWSYPTLEGHAATDNAFVTVTGDDLDPDLAIGRLPVTEPEEVAAIVAKTIRYATRAGVGPWRRELLWIDDGAPAYRWTGDTLAPRLAARGFASTAMTPASGSLAGHRERLLEALGAGPRLVHFLGHGGRYIWRTAGADLDGQQDLLSLEDLDRLPPSDRLPIVLSMTCYSAPFDHPNADSIGEKLLRLPRRGAVAVVAASWRNAPLFAMSRALVDELTRPGTVGEAVRRAKRGGHPDFIQQYNLLGDPALPLPGPAAVAEVAVDLVRDLPVASVRLPAEEFSGRVRLDWVDAKGMRVRTEDRIARSHRFEARFPGSPAEAARLGAVAVYAWDGRGFDAAGGTAIPSGSEAATGRPAATPAGRFSASPPGPAPATESPSPQASPPSLPSLPSSSSSSASLANTIRWTTSSEVDSYGFDVYRAEAAGGPWTRLTERPIPGAGTTDLPQRYEFVDSSITPGREYFYFVESLSTAGLRRPFTPVRRAAPKGVSPPAPPG